MLHEFEFTTLTQLAADKRGIPSSLPLEMVDEKSLDIQKLISLARKHKLTNTLLSALKLSAVKKLILPPTQTPTPAAAAAAQKNLVNIQKTALLEKTSRTFMVEEALRICQTLTLSNLPALIIKGPILSLQLYGSPIVREYTDIDIIVDTQNFITIDQIMHQLGYRADPESQIKQLAFLEHPKSYIQKPHHIVYKNPSHPYRIEIHTEIFNSQLFNRELFTDRKTCDYYTIQNIFSRAETLTYKETLFPAVSKVDHLLFMIAHGTKHGWSQLHWVLDAAALLTTPEPSLHTAIAEGSRLLTIEKHTVLMISVVTALLSIPIPSAYEELTAQYQHQIQKQTAIALNMLQSPTALQPPILKMLQFSWNYTVPLAPTLKEKINIILNPFKASPADIAQLPLPGWLLPLHLLARPFFVLSRRMVESTQLGSCVATAGDRKHDDGDGKMKIGGDE